MDGPRGGGCAAWRVGGEAGRAPSGGMRSCACSRTGWGRHHHHHHHHYINIVRLQVPHSVLANWREMSHVSNTCPYSTGEAKLCRKSKDNLQATRTRTPPQPVNAARHPVQHTTCLTRTVMYITSTIGSSRHDMRPSMNTMEHRPATYAACQLAPLSTCLPAVPTQ